MNIKYMITTLIVFFSLHQAQAQTELAKNFKDLEKSSKGAFGPNVLQGAKSRIGVLNGSPAGSFLFQAAYRNENAEKLATQHNFYVGNLFTTNYYQLMGEFVYGDKYSNHELNHQALLDQASKAMPKASLIVKHWVLEKHYTQKFSHSALARGFRVRGISGSEFEVPYAEHFLNFYISAIDNDFQFLAGSLLAKQSAVAESGSLEKARILIAELYEDTKTYYGDADPRTKRMYSLRNAIHNQLSQSVIGQIETYVKDFPEFAADQTLAETKRILIAYYAVSAKKISDAARVLRLKEIAAVADELHVKFSVAQALKLSQLVAQLRTQLTTSQIPYNKKTDTLLVLVSTSQYLNRTLNGLKEVSTKEIFKILLNVIYIDGFLIQDNWSYFQGEIESAQLANVGTLVSDMISISSDTLTQAFQPALDQWITVEPKMDYFLDNTIKGSSLNTISILAERIKR